MRRACRLAGHSTAAVEAIACWAVNSPELAPWSAETVRSATLVCITRIVQLEGEANFLVLGEVIGVHLRDDCVVDGKFDILKYQPLTRLGYRDYSRITEVFSLKRPGE